MKWTLLFFIIPLLSKAQTEKVKFERDGDKLYTIIAVDSLPKNKLYNLAKEWVYKTYRSGDAVIQMEDKESGKLVCQGRTARLVYMNTFAKMDGGTFRYDLSIYCKDGKVKAVVYNIIHQGGEMVQMKDGSGFFDEFPSTWGSWSKKQSQREWIKMKEQASNEFATIFYTLAQTLTSGDEDANF